MGRLQATARSSGTLEVARAIALLCYAKVEEGSTKAEAEQLRNDLYMRASGSEPPKKRQKKVQESVNTMTVDEQAIVKRLEGEGRLAGALSIAGRAENLKNAPINGTYAPISAGFEGRPAYEKVHG